MGDINGALVDDYVHTHKKDQLVGFMLTLVFGPLGLFYSSWVVALILVVVLFLVLYRLLVQALV